MGRPVRFLVRRFLEKISACTSGRLLQPTVSEGWESYARRHSTKTGGHLGDEWNQPETVGMDVPAGRMLPYLDKEIFAPFLQTPEVILEIGPGGGRFTEMLLPKCTTLIAAETAPTMLRLLRRRFAGNAKLQCLLLDGRGLSSVASDTVDAVFSYGVFVHLQHWDIFNYLCEIRRVLKPGGKAVIQHANTFSQLGWTKFLSDVPSSLNRHKRPGSFSVMTPELMRGFVERAGLVLERCRVDVVRRDCISLIRKTEP